MDKFIIYNGVEMVEGWPEQIREAQGSPEVLIEGVSYQRIRYGDECDDWGAEKASCRDCGVVKDQLHVPGCDVERCPRCGGQVITCSCLYDEEVEADAGAMSE